MRRLPRLSPRNPIETVARGNPGAFKQEQHPSSDDDADIQQGVASMTAAAPHSPKKSRLPRSIHSRILRFTTIGSTVLTVASVAAAIFQSHSARPIEPHSTVAPVLLTTRTTDQAVTRTQSCASASCHGSIQDDIRPEKIRADEYFVWLNDPHANAFQVLTEKRSRAIFQNLGVADEDLKPLPGRGDEFVKQFKNCRGCHESNQHLAESTDLKTAPLAIAEGVSCESCHGRADQWLHAHYQADWSRAVTDQSKKEMGLIGTHDLTTRIKQCSTCHIGSDRGEVNHDLIAAGHPALRFEYVWYLSRLPQHWKPDRQTALKKNKISPTQVWLTGQLVTSITSFEQLERRLSGSGFQPTLPELADYNCFACHHDLQRSSWRQVRGFPTIRGTGKTNPYLGIPWGNWNLGLIPMLADQFGTKESKSSSLAFTDFVEAIQARTRSSNTKLIEQSQKLRKSLEGWLQALDQNPDIDQLLSLICKQNPQQVVSDWDKTANILLGFAASYRSENEVPERLKQGMNSIRFPETPRFTDSPEQFLSFEHQPTLNEAYWQKLLKQLSH